LLAKRAKISLEALIFRLFAIFRHMQLKNNVIFTLPRFFNKAFGKYRLQIILLAVLGFINSVLEGIGISTVIPIFSFVANDGAKGTDIISRTIERIFSWLNLGYNVRNLLIFIGVLFILKVLVMFVKEYITDYVMANYQKNTRTSILGSVLKSNWPYLSQQKLGHLDQIMTTNINNISSLFGCFSTLLLVFAKVLVYSVIVVNISLVIALATVVMGLVSFFIFKPLFYKAKEISSKTELLNRTSSHYINENVLGMKTIKSMNVEKSVLKKAVGYFDDFRKYTMELVIVRGLTDVLLQIIGVGFIMVAFVFFYKTSVFNFASFAVMVYAVNQVFLQIQASQAQLHRIVALSPYMNKVIEYIGEADKHKEQDSGSAKFSFKNNIEFKAIVFHYNESDSVLNGLNFDIKKGEMIGLIGPSGAGKTTIVDLILRLYTPVNGEILIDGKNIDTIEINDWRNNIGYVSQDIFLMNDTVANNIKFYDSNIKTQDIERAAKMANIYGFIKNLPDQFETIIGERGVLLSAGQRQRIIIARVLAKNPEFLILDEATSALDNESEIEVQKVIEGLKGKITVLAIAHRLSTVINSDRLVVIENGKITESASPEKLLKEKKSYFAKVYNLRAE